MHRDQSEGEMLIDPPDIRTGEWPQYTFTRTENMIELGYSKNFVMTESHWIKTLCHEVNHWAQMMFVETEEVLHSTWSSKINLGSGGYGMLEKAANCGIRPTGTKTICVNMLQKGVRARPLYYRRVSKIKLAVRC